MVVHSFGIVGRGHGHSRSVNYSRQSSTVLLVSEEGRVSFVVFGIRTSWAPTLQETTKRIVKRKKKSKEPMMQSLSYTFVV